mgnify:CR=1 FL=1
MFNLFGLIFVLLLLVPNLVFAVTHKDGFENLYHNKTVELLEQIGRFGCFLLEFLEIPFLCRGIFFDGGRTVYLAVGATLVALYLLGWAVFWKESSLRKAIALSVLPSLLFLESGILTLNLPLIAFALLFAPCHTIIGVKNALAEREKKKGLE